MCVSRSRSVELLLGMMLNSELIRSRVLIRKGLTRMWRRMKRRSLVRDLLLSLIRVVVVYLRFLFLMGLIVLCILTSWRRLTVLTRRVVVLLLVWCLMVTVLRV